jgi:hypothetical protein
VVEVVVVVSSTAGASVAALDSGTDSRAAVSGVSGSTTDGSGAAVDVVVVELDVVEDEVVVELEEDVVVDDAEPGDTVVVVLDVLVEVASDVEVSTPSVAGAADDESPVPELSGGAAATGAASAPVVANVVATAVKNRVGFIGRARPRAGASTEHRPARG